MGQRTKESRSNYFNPRKAEFNVKRFQVYKEDKFILIKIFTIKI